MSGELPLPEDYKRVVGTLSVLLQVPHHRVVNEVMALLGLYASEKRGGSLLTENSKLREEVAELSKALREETGKTAVLEGQLKKRLNRVALKEVPGADLSQPAMSRYNQAVRSAYSRKKSWNITPELYAELASKPCDYCGGKTGSGVGLDRLNHKVGYEIDNVVPCCPSCNMMRRHTLSPEQVKAAVRAIQKLEA